MIVLDKYKNMIDELENYFNSYDPQEEMFKAELEAMPDNSIVQRKLFLIDILVKKSDIAVFRYFPFYSQFTAGRPRNAWGGLLSAYGGLYLNLKEGRESFSEYSRTFKEDRQKGMIFNWDNPIGNDHHAINYDLVLKLGLDGILKKVEKHSENCDDEKKEFYDSVKASVLSLIELSNRFAKRAEEMLKTETDCVAKKNLERIAKTAKKIPLAPAETFYEALSTIFFLRECVGTLEGIGISTFGHLDRMLFPYYERDIKNGILTKEEAKDLIAALFVYTAVRFEENTNPHDTSTTIVLGGCDADGNVIYNEVTDIVLDAELEGRYVGLKIDCRVSKAHPKAYLEKACKVLASGLFCLVFLNDDTYIESRVKHGQDLRDARLYLAGGCHEMVLGGTEVCSRADTFIGLAGIFMETLSKRRYDDFEDLYRQSIEDVKNYHIKVETAKSKVEDNWHNINPMPLYSSMMTGCLEKGIDVTAGGSKYASVALSMVGPATFIDSLWTVKTLCFDEKKMSTDTLYEILMSDYEGNEKLRQYIINRIPKYCTGSDELDEFTCRVFSDLSKVSGRVSKGGRKYYPAFYSHSNFIKLGNNTPATPDGRKRGFAVSRGCSPSEFLTGVTPGDMLKSVKALDYTNFTDSFSLEMTLPRMDVKSGIGILLAITEEFIENGGSTLQINMLDKDMLIEAQKEPEKHRDLIVRVCGYSYYFVHLRKELQDEVISRAIRG